MGSHFTLSEFTHSDVATERGIDNTLPPELEPTSLLTLDMMERVRGHLSKVAGRDTPVITSSGYRCPALNSAIGSKPTSDHVKAMACDFTAPSFGTPLEVAQALAPVVSILGIGQLIYEILDRPGHPRRWVHASICPTEKPINRVITVSNSGTVAGIMEI